MSAGARPGDVEVFATGTTTITIIGDRHATGTDHRPGATAELLRRTGAAVRDVHARPGYRPGRRIATAGARRGGETDIVRPLLVRPEIAGEAATSGRMFDPPVDGFALDATPDGRSDDLEYLVWHGSLSGDHVREVPVALHLLASPSLIVTVLELVPMRSLRWNRRGFVEDGVRVVDAFADRLARLCERPAA